MFTQLLKSKIIEWNFYFYFILKKLNKLKKSNQVGDRFIKLTFLYIGWLVGYRCKANCPLVGPGPIGGVPSVGIILRDFRPYLREFCRKPRKTSNQPRIEPGTSCLPALSAEPLFHWWGPFPTENITTHQRQI